MLTRKRLLLAVAVIVIIPSIAIAWWLVSPLFISKTVEEEFPFAFDAVVPTDMTISEVENVMAVMAKFDQEVNEALPDMSGKRPSAPNPAPGNTDTPTPTATASPAFVPTATPMPVPVPESPGVGPQIESAIKNFILQDLAVEVGATVAWANQDGARHTTTAGSPGNATGQWDSGPLTRGSSYEFTFDEVGVFPYFCKIHPDTMQAVVRVAATPGLTSVPTQAPTAAPTTTPPTPSPASTATPTTIPPAAPAVAGPVKLKEGSFRDADSVHRGSGQATIYLGPDGSRLLRLDDLSVTNGPDLHVILSPHSNPERRDDVKAPGYVDLGKLKGNKGNQNYTIPDGVEVAAQGSIVIYCKPFHVIFSVASLQDVE